MPFPTATKSNCRIGPEPLMAGPVRPIPMVASPASLRISTASPDLRPIGRGAPPQAGSPNFYARPYDGVLYSNGAPRLEIFEFHTDWGNQANTTFGLVQTIIPATFRSDICNGGNLNQYCVPQPGAGTSNLDALSIWPMAPLQYLSSRSACTSGLVAAVCARSKEGAKETTTCEKRAIMLVTKEVERFRFDILIDYSKRCDQEPDR